MKKKVFLLLLLTTISISGGFSQSHVGEHLNFRDIPLSGNIGDFAGKLVKQGYTISRTKDNAIYLNGNIYGKECEISVFGSLLSNTIWSLEINLKTDSTWRSLKNNYYELLFHYATIYKWDNSYAQFEEPYREGDGYELQAIAARKYRFCTSYNTGSGNITIEILPSKNVCIRYNDKINSLINSEERKFCLNS